MNIRSVSEKLISSDKYSFLSYLALAGACKYIIDERDRKNKRRMEVMLPVEDMQEATEVAEFLESMTEKGQRAFMNFVRG